MFKNGYDRHLVNEGLEEQDKIRDFWDADYRETLPIFACHKTGLDMKFMKIIVPLSLIHI